MVSPVIPPPVDPRHYRFHGLERVQYNKFPSDAERRAYLRFAGHWRSQPNRQGIQGFRIMSAWKKDLPENERSYWLSLELDDSDIEEPIEISIRADDEPDEETQKEDVREPDPEGPRVDDGVRGDLHYRFVRTLWRAPANGRMTTKTWSESLNKLYVGVDPSGRIRDVSKTYTKLLACRTIDIADSTLS